MMMLIGTQLIRILMNLVAGIVDTVMVDWNGKDCLEEDNCLWVVVEVANTSSLVEMMEASMSSLEVGEEDKSFWEVMVEGKNSLVVLGYF
jgi:hypothetical protein